MHVQIQDGCHLVGQITLKKFKKIFTMGSFKCYVTLEGVGGYMSKRYEALRGGGGGVTSALRNVFFF